MKTSEERTKPTISMIPMPPTTNLKEWEPYARSWLRITAQQITYQSERKSPREKGASVREAILPTRE